MAEADGDGDGDDEQRAEEVAYEIPNDCDMATELVPKPTENEQPSVPNDIITDSRDSYDHRDLTATDVTAKDFRWRSNERITVSLTGQSH
jgi:hypothetical protein